MTQRICFIWLFVLSTAGIAAAQPAAVIVTGSAGSPMYARHYKDRATRFVSVLTKAGVSAERITLLSADEAWKGAPVTGVAGQKTVDAALASAASSLKPADQFILVLIGHGAMTEDGPTFAVPGRDVSMRAVADALKPLKARSQIILNFSAAAGDALPLLAMPGRVNIAGSSPSQVNDNDFAEFFLQELEAGSPNLLETYNKATERFGKWIVRQKQNPAEGGTGWFVEGKESAAIFKKLYAAEDVPENRKFASSPDADQPDDANPPLVAEATPRWSKRRLITEYPTIDDAGKGAAVSAIGVSGLTGVKPGAESPIGNVAGKTTIGRTN